MNTYLHQILAAGLMAVAVPVLGEPPKTNAVTKLPPKSIFILPNGSHEGRDPFYPESQRPYEESATATTNKSLTFDTTALTVKAFSSDNGRLMVIINNHTFAVGEEGDVTAVSVNNVRSRVHLHLININLQDNLVVVEVHGTRRELHITNK